MLKFKHKSILARFGRRLGKATGQYQQDFAQIKKWRKQGVSWEFIALKLGFNNPKDAKRYYGNVKSLSKVS